MSRSHRGDTEPLGNSLRAQAELIFASVFALTSEKVTLEIIINLLLRVAGSLRVCVCLLIFLFLRHSWHNEMGSERGPPREREKSKEMESGHKSSQGPGSCSCSCFFFSPSCLPTFDASIVFFFNLIKQSAVHRVRWGLSISLIKQELIKGLPVPMQEKGLSHIMHNLLDKKKPLHTNKEIKSRVKSNSRGIVKSGRHVVLYTWQDLCTSAMHLYALLCLNSDKLMSSQ